ncbi:hypothetical protein PFISCL1PPCAC_2635, partial [Pristionchus fissidentatus]
LQPRPSHEIAPPTRSKARGRNPSPPNKLAHTKRPDTVAPPTVINRSTTPSFRPTAAASASASASSNSSSAAAASRRGQKTLGWFLSEQLIEKTGSPSPPVQTKQQHGTAAGVMAGGAVMSAEEKKRRRGGRGHRTRKLTESLSTASEASLPMMETDEEKKGDQALITPSDFYVYDVASDGYYYEQNGAKGWRRRLPQGVQPKKPAGGAAAVAAAVAAAAAQQTGEDQLQQAALAAAMQRNHMNALQAAIGQSAAYNRYYDAPSDGYYFEMASVDGWRKRTAAPSAGAPAAFGRVPAARGPAGYNGGVPMQFMSPFAQMQQAAAASAQQPNQSYGAALARGELPAKCMMESSASSSVSDDLSYPSLSRPTSLDLATAGPFGMGGERKEEDNVLGWNPDKFIEELVGQFSTSARLDAFSDSFGGDLKTPATSMWHRRYSATTSSTTGGEEAEEEEQEEYALTKELENIWKTPTPVQH